MSEALERQLGEMSDNVKALTGVLTQLAPRMEKMEAQMSEVQAERSQTQQAIAAAQSAEAQQKASEGLVAAILAGLGEQVKTEVSASIGKVINPSGQPRQKTMTSPISASQIAEESYTSRDELLITAGALKEKLTRTDDQIKRNELIEQLSAVKYQLQTL